MIYIIKHFKNWIKSKKKFEKRNKSLINFKKKFVNKITNQKNLKLK